MHNAKIRHAIFISFFFPYYKVLHTHFRSWIYNKCQLDNFELNATQPVQAVLLLIVFFHFVVTNVSE